MGELSKAHKEPCKGMGSDLLDSEEPLTLTGTCIPDMMDTSNISYYEHAMFL
jgi:hypothetical protein